MLRVLHGYPGDLVDVGVVVGDVLGGETREIAAAGMACEALRIVLDRGRNGDSVVDDPGRAVDRLAGYWRT